MIKKDDLKSTLDKIQPRKELIDDTIRKANELRFSQKKSSIFDAFNFNFKFATAMCALFLVVCVGIIAFNNGIFTNAGLSPIASVNHRSSDITSYYNENKITGNASDLIAEAKLSGGDWVVLCGAITNCAAQKNEEGIYYSIHIDSPQICDHNLNDIDNYNFNSGTDVILKTTDNDTINTLINLMSSPMFITLQKEVKNGNTFWVIADFVPEK